MMSKGKELGIVGLSAIVFSTMVGGGIFNIAQNMAASASVGAVAISWGITGFGVLFLVLTFRTLADNFPDINEGIYQYAQAGFGNYVGFNIAWGYWLCVALGNVAFAVMLNDAIGAFFPILLKHGIPTIIFAMCLIWGMYLIAIRGVTTASFINTVMTLIKLSAIAAIVIILIIYFKAGIFSTDFPGHLQNNDFRSLGSLGQQVMSTMLVTMFCFVGIEGAVMLSSHAKKPSYVGKASIIGFAAALTIYALISILCYGIMTQPELARLEDPSVAYVLKECCGEWAYYFVIITVIVSLLSAWISWTLLCAQTPYGAAKVKMLPQDFLKVNRYGAPAFGLRLSSIFMSLFIILVCTAPNVYRAALNLTTIMVLPAYLLSGAFLWKTTLNKTEFSPSIGNRKLIWYRCVGIICTAYCLWCICAGSFLIFLITSIFYLIGVFFYYRTRRQLMALKELPSNDTLFNGKEKLLLAILIICSTISVILLVMGKVNLSA